MLPSIVGLINKVSAPVSTNSYESIATVTVGAGGSSLVTFSAISSGYSHLQLRIMNLGSSSAQDLRCRFNGDTGSNYNVHYMYGNGSSAAAGSTGANSYTFAGLTSISTSAPEVSIVDILDYTNVNKNKVTRTLAGTDGNGSGYTFLYSGLWLNTAAITQIDLSPNGGSFNQYSSFALYGVK